MTYIIPVAIFLITYIRMGRRLWSSEIIGEVNDGQLSALRSKRKVVYMLVIVTIIFVICWLPYHVYFVYTYHDRKAMAKPWIQHVYLLIYFFAMSNAAYNPIIYVLASKR